MSGFALGEREPDAAGGVTVVEPSAAPTGRAAPSPRPVNPAASVRQAAQAGHMGARPPREPLVAASGLTYAYGFRKVLDAVDFHVSPAEIVAVFGPNGAGKSTLLRVLSGLLPPTAGSVRWWGRPLEETPVAARHVAFVGHRSHLFPELTARENLLYYARLLGMAQPEAAVAAALREEGLALFADQRVATYSRGMVQRLSLCRAWLADPLLAFADEPATGLDPDAALRLSVALQGLRRRGGAAVLVAHDLPGALAVADRFVVLAAGRVAAAGEAAPWRGQSESFADLYRGAVTRARAAARAGPWAPALVAAGDRPPSSRGPAGEPAAPGDRPVAAEVVGPGPAGGTRDLERDRWPGGLGQGPVRGTERPPATRPHTQVSRLGVLRAVFSREAALWWRGQERLGAILANGVLVALVFGLAFDPLAVGLVRLFAGILWLGLLFTGLPAFGRGFALEWETDAIDAYLACGAEPAVLFYGKCLANLAGFLLGEAVLVPVFFVLLEVRPGPGLPGALAALALGSAGFVAAGTLIAALVSRALGGGAGGLLPLVALPLLSPVIFGTARLAQDFFDGRPEMPGVWFLLLAVYAALFWVLPALLFPFVAAG